MARHLLDKAGEIRVRGIVGAVGNGAHGDEGQAVVMADLGHGSAFHLHSQAIRQTLAQGLAFGAGGDEAVAAQDQAFVYAGCLQAEFGHGCGAQGGLRVSQYLARRRCQRVRQCGIGFEACLAIQRHLMLCKQRGGVHVVLQKAARQHHIAHVHAVGQSAGHAGKDDGIDLEALDQRRRRGGRRHLADAREHRHHLAPMPVAAPEAAAGHARLVFVGHAVEHGREFIAHSGNDADAAGGGQRKRHGRRVLSGGKSRYCPIGRQLHAKVTGVAKRLP